MEDNILSLLSISNSTAVIPLFLIIKRKSRLLLLCKFFTHPHIRAINFCDIRRVNKPCSERKNAARKVTKYTMCLKFKDITIVRSQLKLQLSCLLCCWFVEMVKEMASKIYSIGTLSLHINVIIGINQCIQYRYQFIIFFNSSRTRDFITVL